jgi:glycosyltransferase involved in cell wall biosynthesis
LELEQQRPLTEPVVSVVVPVYDEEDSVLELYRQTRDACQAVGLPWEIVFVDDGSADATFELLKKLHDRDSNVRVVKFRKNYGQTAAMTAGFRFARGNVIVSMDGDLQNDPADIPRLLSKMDEGFEVVCGWRKNRQDRVVSRKIPSKVANWIIGRATGVRIHDNGCSLKAYRAEVIKRTRLYSELHRFIPAMSTLSGARIAEIVVNHRARQFGQSKYGLGRVWRVALDIITVMMLKGFALRPALWFGTLSLPAWLSGTLMLLVAGLRGGMSADQRLLVATAASLLLYLAAHLLSMGIIGELAIRTGSTRQLSPFVGRMVEPEVNREPSSR